MVMPIEMVVVETATLNKTSNCAIVNLDCWNIDVRVLHFLFTIIVAGGWQMGRQRQLLAVVTPP